MCKVVIADDDNDILEITGLVLYSHGFQVEKINDAHKVFETILSLRPKVLLMDINMAGVDGREICKLIKAHPEIGSTKIILFSASANIRENLNDCIADDILDKPFDIRELVQKVKAQCTALANY